MIFADAKRAQQAAQELKVYILPWIQSQAGASGGSGSGTALTPAEYPDALLVTGERPLVGNLAVGEGRTVDGVDLSAFWSAYQAHALDPSAHHLAFTGLRAPDGTLVTPDSGGRVSFVPGPGATLEAAGAGAMAPRVVLSNPSGLALIGMGLGLSEGVAGSGLSLVGQVLHVGAGDGVAVGADTVGLLAPGVLSVASTGVAAGNHTHAITSSSNPGAARQLLATDAAGNLTLRDLLLARTDDATPLRITRGPNPSLGTASIWAEQPRSQGYNSGRVLQASAAGEAEPRMVLFTDRLGLGPGGASPLDMYLTRIAPSHAALAGDAYGAMPAHLSIAGNVRVGRVGTDTPPAKLTVQASAAHVRLEHASNPAVGYADLAVDAGGSATLASEGLIYVNPRGRAVLPVNPYETDLGSITNKYLTIHAAELRVETLVAQQTLATIGGRILVGPTTVLVEPLAAAATTAMVKHNSVQVGDTLLMEGGGQVEFVTVTGVDQNLIRNASFETWDGVGVFTYWSPVGTVTASQTLDDPANGRAALRIA